MEKVTRRKARNMARAMAATVLTIGIILGAPLSVSADDAYARKTLKAMSDYMTAQGNLSFEYDATLEVVSKDAQKLAIVSSGSIVLNRPDKIYAKRNVGFADVASSFDGKTLTIFGKNLNMYAQVEIPGTVSNLIAVLHEKYNRPLPAADLLLPDPYTFLIQDVYNVKDLGVGVVGGVECDYFAFRAKEVDWQIWIAQGDRPYPCRYTINSKDIEGQPEYTVQIRDWKSGNDVAATDFSFKNTTDAKLVDLKGLKGTGSLPEHFSTGETK